MQNDLLTHECERLERFLASGPRPEPSARLRERVLGNVRSQLHRRRRVARWRFGSALAALLLLNIGVSLTAGYAVASAMHRRESLPSLHEVAQRIREMSPEISPEESVRQAMLVRIAAEVGCQANLGHRYEGVLAFCPSGELTL